ncbi:hypothetical protein DL767_011034 [Monosporascus sp. MG133]|nr:hypothetical protein DL767_011034 [Monosporascus sp. MG133]
MAEDSPAPKPDEPTTPLQELWAVAKAHSHPEIWGVTLEDPATHVPSQIVFQKYLNANDGDVVQARDQLTKTLDWRAKTKPLDLIKQSFSKAKFEGLGYVTSYSSGQSKETEPEAKEVFTWNIYGGVKNIDETFGKLEEFINWRVALMELALQELSISTATKPISVDYDPYKIYQVHDYKGISFLRQSPQVKAAIPALMGFMYAFMKLFVAAKTAKKFHPMSNGGGLAKEFSDSKVEKLGEKLPPEYGGKGADLKSQGKETALEA